MMLMRFPVRTLLSLLSLSFVLSAQNNSLESRGFTVRKTDADGKQKMVTVPRGYALVIGVGKYLNLDPKENLRFAESDAMSVYRARITQEGGAFPAENVHKLIGPDATRANIRRELEEWLPNVALVPD